MRLLRGSTRRVVRTEFRPPVFCWAVAALVLVSTGLLPTGLAQEEEATAEETDLENEVAGDKVGLPGLGNGVGAIYRECCLSVVSVRAKTELGERLTTGFFVGDGSVIATVLDDDTPPESVSVVHVDASYPAKIVVMDERMRVALLVADGLKGKPLGIDDLRFSAGRSLLLS